MRVKNNKPKADKQSIEVLIRLLRYVISRYKLTSFLVFVFVLISSLTSVVSSLFLKSLIDDYVTPILVSEGVADFTPLFHALCMMGAIYLIGTFIPFY